ncbi:MAG: acylphosphatase [Candidatus Altiarchaeota archaeon]
MKPAETTRKALFYISGKQAQHIGCRLTVTAEMIHAGFLRGGAFNLPDGRVEVVLEGRRQDIESFHERMDGGGLAELIIQRANDQDAVRKLIGNPGLIVYPLEYRDDILGLTSACSPTEDLIKPRFPPR